jgi:rhodanese-related sulfurtransferase
MANTSALSDQETKINLPERKQTVLGLYATARESYDMWRANPDKVSIVDVRTVIEYIWVGHTEMSITIPAFVQTSKWDEERKYFALAPEPNFVTEMEKRFDKNAILILFCRSGERSALAVNMMAKAGFTQVYTMTDGFEGDMVTDPDNVFVGKRMKNGWKNAGLPWTYRIDPKMVIVPEQK